MAQLRRHRDRLEALGVDVLVVTFERPEVAAAYQKETELDWPIVLDPDHALYRAYGMESAPMRELFAPRLWPSYLRLMFGGRLPRRPTGDIHQLGGDILIDPQGIVRLEHASRDPTDRPSTEQILEIVRRGQLGSA